MFCEIILQNAINPSTIVPDGKNSISAIPITKNGPNGIYSSSIFFCFLYIIIPIAKTDEIKNASNVISKTFLNPKNNPDRRHKLNITHTHCFFSCNYSDRRSAIIPNIPTAVNSPKIDSLRYIRLLTGFVRSIQWRIVKNIPV